MVMKSKRTVRLLSLIMVLGMMLTSLPVAGVTAEDFTSQIPTKETAGATFRLGVISDSHLDPEVAETKLTAKNMTLALQTMQTLGVDALAMNGDMVYAPSGAVPANLYSALKGFIETNGTFTLAGEMNEDEVTFEADTTDGKKPIIYSMGNHEFPLNASVSTASALVTESKERFATETGRKPSHVMKINGYTFIVGEPADYLLDYKTTAEEFVMEQILEAEKDGTNKPIFYLQHEAVFGTVIESPSSTSTDKDNTEEFKNFLKEHPRVVVFSGHSHAIIEDPRSIWQDGFTAIATSQIGGGSVSGGSANYSMGEANTGSQCIMLDMTEKADATDVSVYRLNLLTGKVIGTPFNFTINGTFNPDNETFKYTQERYNANVSIANFNETATITPTRESRQSYKFRYTTDVAVTAGEDVDWLQDAYVHAYRVVLKNKDKNVVEQNFKIFSDVYEAESSHAASYDVTLPNALNLGTNYELAVYALTPFTTNLSVSALDALGVEPVSYTFETAAELTDAEKASIAENGGINVALNKTVYTAASSSDDKNNLVNGKYNDKVTPGTYVAGSQISLPSGATVSGAANQGEDWFMIDLGRRYKLAKVKAWPSSAASNGYMMDFAIQVSNTEDFSTYTPLGSFTRDVNNKTPQVFEGDNNAWRYVRMAKTKNTYFTIGELEIFAEVKTAEDLIGPKVMAASRVDDNTISVSFAHKMDETSLKATDALKIVQNDGTSITPSAVTLTGADEWDGGYDATLTFANALPANGLTLKIAGSVASNDGATFVDEVSMPIAGKALTINKSYSTTREDVNVALNKTVIASNTGCPTTGNYAVSKLVDGSTTGFVAPADVYSADKVTLPSGAKADPSTSQANDWYMIDLGRRYAVTSVVVHPAADKPAANYWGFVVEGSNDETFANSVPLGEVKANDTTVDGTTAVTFNGDGSAYRYIRLRKTANTYYLYSEIEVFADMTITNVAQGKATEWGDAYSTLTGDKAVDGKTGDSYSWRLAGVTSSITNLVINLGAEYPVEMAQMHRASSYTDAAFTLFNVYGYSAAAGKPAVTGTPANPTATLFTTTGLTTSSKYFNFAQGNYQYIVLSKPKSKALALAEFKAFVVNPVAYSAVANGDNTITISFTDKMEITTLVANNFSIDGITLSNPVVAGGWDGGYDVTFDYNGTIVNGDKLTISSKVRNQNGIEMAADKTLSIKANIFTIEQNGFAVTTPVGNTACDIIANFIPEADTSVVLYVAVKTDQGVLINCIPSETVEVTAGAKAQVSVANITPKAGEKLSFFLWENETLKPLFESYTAPITAAAE